MERHVYNTFIGLRIDKALSEYFGLSRNFFQNLLERKLIQIKTSVPDSESLYQTSTVKKSYILEGGETIILPALQRYADNQIMEESPRIELKIQYQTADYLVLYKPKGVLSHPKTLFDVSQPSVSGFLYHTFGALPGMSGLVRGGIVHRLDKDTDGLMIVALSERGLAYFRDLFDKKAQAVVDWKGYESQRKHGDVELHKYYRAICDITPKGELWLKRNGALVKGDGEIVLDSLIYPKTSAHGYPKRGVTIIKKIVYDTEDRAGSCVIELELITGRTHQIRYQLAEIGLPVAGDYLYNEPGSIRSGRVRGELQLTAFKLEFVDCDGIFQSIVV